MAFSLFIAITDAKVLSFERRGLIQITDLLTNFTDSNFEVANSGREALFLNLKLKPLWKKY